MPVKVIVWDISFCLLPFRIFPVRLFPFLLLSNIFSHSAYTVKKSCPFFHFSFFKFIYLLIDFCILFLFNLSFVSVQQHVPTRLVITFEAKPVSILTLLQT